jgi:uncharacterized protein (DUF58 family)
LILDTLIHGESKKYREEIFEKAVSLAASIASHFIREGAGMEFLTPRKHVPRGTGTNHLYRILQSLAVVQCEMAQPSDASNPWNQDSFSKVREAPQIFSDKVFKIIITSKPRGSFSSAVWRSSHVVFFDEI